MRPVVQNHLRRGALRPEFPFDVESDQGGRIPLAMPIQLSNLALIDGNGKATRIGFREEDGKKVRFAKSTGETV